MIIDKFLVKRGENVMFVVSDADRRNKDKPGEVYERFYYRHEAFKFADERMFAGTEGIVLFEENHWVSSDEEKYAYGPYGDSDSVRIALRKISKEKSTDFHTTVELVRVK